MAGRSAVDLQNPWWEKSTAPNMKTIESVEHLITELVRCCRGVTPYTAMTTLCACALWHCHPSLLRSDRCHVWRNPPETCYSHFSNCFCRTLQSQARDKLVVVDFYARWYETPLSCRHLFMPPSPLPLTLHACCSSIQLCRTMHRCSLPASEDGWFHFRRCGSCKALYPKLCKLAEANPECIVLKVDFDDNKKL